MTIVTPKILFIDDEPQIIEPLSEEVESIGYLPLKATNGRDGFALIEQHHESIALIIADYQMGDSNGLDLRRQSMELYSRIPFIIYSGFISKQMLHDALDLKVSRFIEKPFDVERIKQVIEEEASERIEYIQEKATLKKIFLEEANDLLEDLEGEILALSDGSGSEHINNIFRIVHTIKGGSGVLDWPPFTQTVHKYEDLLTKIKNQQVPISQSVISTLLQGYDFINKAINSLEDDEKLAIDVASWTEIFNKAQSGSGDNINNAAPTNTAPTNSKHEDSIKIPTYILDEFMELSGEITVIRNTVNKLVFNLQKEMGGNRNILILGEFLEEMHKINSSMQNKITELRKVSLKNIYRSLPRTVRDLNQSLNKNIELQITGSDLRVDTKLAQILKNSLIHVVRNSADHGIESPEERKDSGKQDAGKIEIRSFEQGDDVIVEVEDNGKGIDPDFIAQRAIDKNLYSAESIQDMTKSQICKIIMEPGFSTASQVTDISGRGVGMDMVKSSVESIGGRIDIDSTKGSGTKFSFKLPIPKSVMIIQSLLVKIAQRELSIPQDSILRLIKVEPEKRKQMIALAENCELLKLDGKLIQLVDLSEDLSNEKNESSCNDTLDIVLVKSDHMIFGILVDEIKDTEEIVVKKIPEQIKNKIFKGATFMGDGTVGLILDIDGIASHCNIVDAAHDLSASLIEEEHDRGEEYILFTLPCHGLFGFQLSEVYRLEELETSSFTFISGQMTTIYRDTVVPLFVVHEMLDISSTENLLEKTHQSTIIIKRQEHFFGLIIDSIREIKYITGEVDKDLSSQDNIDGSLISGEDVVTVINIYQLLGIKPPEKMDIRAEDLEELKDVPIASEDETSSSGWGLF